MITDNKRTRKGNNKISDRKSKALAYVVSVYTNKNTNEYANEILGIPVADGSSNTPSERLATDDYKYTPKYAEWIMDSSDLPVETFCDWITFYSGHTACIPAETIHDLIGLMVRGHYFAGWSATSKIEYKVAVADTTKNNNNQKCLPSSISGDDSLLGEVSLKDGGNKGKWKSDRPFDLIYSNEIKVKLKVRWNRGLHGEILDHGQVELQFSGIPLSHLIARNNFLLIGQLLHDMSKYGLHATRLDLSIDDFSKRFSILEVESAVRSDSLIHMDFWDVRASGTGKGLTGITVQCGSSNSDFSCHMYETTVKHPEMSSANRIESRWKNKKLKMVCSWLVQFYTDFINDKRGSLAIDDYLKQGVKFVQSLIVSNVVFKDRSLAKANGSTKHLPQLPFWEDFKNYLGDGIQYLRVTVRKSEVSAFKTFHWWFRSVKHTLTTMVAQVGLPNFLQLLKISVGMSGKGIWGSAWESNPDNIEKVRQVRSLGWEALTTTAEREIFDSLGFKPEPLPTFDPVDGNLDEWWKSCDHQWAF